MVYSYPRFVCPGDLTCMLAATINPVQRGEGRTLSQSWEAISCMQITFKTNATLPLPPSTVLVRPEANSTETVGNRPISLKAHSVSFFIF